MADVGLIIGHTPDEPGATNPEQQISEWHYNATLARMVASQLDNAQIIMRDRPNDWRGLPSKVNAASADFAVSMHLNAYKGDAKGSEVLYWHTSRQGKALADLLQPTFTGMLGTKDRGTRPREKYDRGWRLLRETDMPIVIAEPFFVDDQLTEMQPKTAELAAAYVSAIDEYRSAGVV